MAVYTVYDRVYEVPPMLAVRIPVRWKSVWTNLASPDGAAQELLCARTLLTHLDEIEDTYTASIGWNIRPQTVDFRGVGEGP